MRSAVSVIVSSPVQHARPVTTIDEAMIDRLIRGFYARVRDDDVLGPIFAEKIEDWEPHLQKIRAFWSSVALMSGRYHGQPMAKHLPLPIGARRSLAGPVRDDGARSLSARGGGAFRDAGGPYRGESGTGRCTRARLASPQGRTPQVRLNTGSLESNAGGRLCVHQGWTVFFGHADDAALAGDFGISTGRYR
jgi:hypothetical protein